MKIPKLPIWDYKAESFCDNSDFSSALWQKVNNVESTVSFESTSPTSRLFTAVIGGLSITSVASMPHSETLEVREGAVLFLPISGEVKILGVQASKKVIAGKSAVIFGEGRWGLENSFVSYLRIYFSKKLAVKIRSMLTSHYDEQKCPNSKDMFLLAYPDPNYVREVIELINVFYKIERRGLGKAISSETALVTLVEKLFSNDHVDLDRHDYKVLKQEPISLVTNAILSDLARPLSLGEMEKITGVSRRNIQYSFKRQYGVSPIAWQLRERLTLAHAALVDRRDTRTITQIAFDLGFGSSSTFSLYFRRQFGVPPSSLRANVGLVQRADHSSTHV